MAQANTMDVDEPSKVKYEISSQLALHKAPVRCLVTVGNDRIISGDRKGNFVDWTRKLVVTDDSVDTKMDGSNEQESNNSNDFDGRLIFDTGLHDLTFSVIKGLEYDVDGTKYDSFISAGDHMAIEWTLEGNVLKQFIGHENSVISIDTLGSGNEIITGSFDSTARIWNLTSNNNNNNNNNSSSSSSNNNNNSGMAQHVASKMTLSGHEHGVEVCTLQSGEIVTGTFKKIFIWDQNGNKIKTIENAHEHMIRKVVRHGLGFLTCANDGYVKLWSNKGDLLRSILAHPENENTPSFVYGLTCDSEGNIFSSGEDGTSKMFDADGKLLCVLRHPGVVWNVKLLENGDLVTACGDGCVRIWSKDESRIASEAKVQEYYNGLAMAMQAQGAPVSDSQLEPMSVLQQPGKPGAFKMVNDPERGPSVYQYDASKGEWAYIGEIMGNKGGNNGGGGGNGGAGEIDGVKYDHVVYIDVNDRDGKFPLGFNIDDDPRQVSRDFCTIRGIDLDLAPQIEAHLKPYANAEARARRLEREAQAASKLLIHIPTYKRCSAEIISKGNIAGLKKKILEFNKDESVLKLNLGVGQKSENESKSGGDSLTSDEELKVLDHLFGVLSDQSNWHVAEFPDVAVKLIATKLILWPTDKILPVLDMIRILMLHANGVVKLLGFNDESGSTYGKKIRTTILEHINGRDSEFTPNMQAMTCRLMSNFLAKRARSQSERQGKCPQDLAEYVQEVVSGLAPAAESKKNTVSGAYLMMVHNVMLWFAKFKVEESDMYVLIASALFEMFSNSLIDSKTNGVNDKILYYGLGIIGTIGWSSDTARTEIMEAFGENLESVAKQAMSHASNQSCREVGNDIRKLFGFK